MKLINGNERQWVIGGFNNIVIQDVGNLTISQGWRFCAEHVEINRMHGTLNLQNQSEIVYCECPAFYDESSIFYSPALGLGIILGFGFGIRLGEFVVKIGRRFIS